MKRVVGSLTNLQRLITISVLSIGLATAYSALSVKPLNASGGCCCDGVTWYIEAACPSPVDCQSEYEGTDCCFDGECYE